MIEGVKISGSLRNRLTVSLIGGAAVLALLMYFIVRAWGRLISFQQRARRYGNSFGAIATRDILRDWVSMALQRSGDDFGKAIVSSTAAWQALCQ